MVQHESIGLYKVFLKFKSHKFYCRSCQRYFNQQFPGILKYQRATEKLKHQIFHHHTEGICQKSLARDFKLGKSTIERWYHTTYQRINQQYLNRPVPIALSIDEHFFSQKEGFATTLCDLKRNKVFDVVKGKSANDLKDYLTQLPGKERVQVVCMDLSSTYKSLVKQYFPNALIVSDRFHVIRLLNHQCISTYQVLDPGIKNNRELLKILRTRTDRLKPSSIEKKDAYLKQNPAIESIEAFRESLYQILMKKTLQARRCKPLIPIFLNIIKALKNSPFKRLARLGKTFDLWNAITEGFHRKMKLIQRRAYGFRNFENYRLRVRVLCG